MTNEKEYTTKKFWDRFPEATHFTPESDGYYAAFWQFTDDTTTPQQGWVLCDDTIIHSEYPTALDRGSLESAIERPEHFEEANMKTTEETFLKPGLICEALWNSTKMEYKKVKVIGFDGGLCVFVWLEGEIRGEYQGEYYTEYYSEFFREIPKPPSQQEKLLDAWKRRGLDYAHDNLKSSATLEEVFDFIVVNYNLEEK